MGGGESEEFGGNEDFREGLLDLVREFFPVPRKHDLETLEGWYPERRLEFEWEKQIGDVSTYEVKLGYETGDQILDKALTITGTPDGVQAAHEVLSSNIQWPTLLGVFNKDTIVAREIRRYLGAIKELAKRFGLVPVNPSDRWWGYDWLHTEARWAWYVGGDEQSLASFGHPPRFVGRNHSYEASKLEFQVHPTISGFRYRGKLLNKSSLLEELFREVRMYVADLEQVLSGAGIEQIRERALWRHIHWLYLAICPDKRRVRPLRYDEIAGQEANEASVNEDTIRKPVVVLAKLLEIQLPHKPGRPQAE